MVSGTLSIKKGYYYAVLSWVDANGNRHRKWVATGLAQKGNKRRAEEALVHIRNTFEPPVVDRELTADMLFSEYLKQWLEVVKVRVKIATFCSYQDMVLNTIAPYFEKKKITLRDLEARHIQQFYTEKLKTVSANSVIHYHAVIYQALKAMNPPAWIVLCIYVGIGVILWIFTKVMQKKKPDTWKKIIPNPENTPSAD